MLTGIIKRLKMTKYGLPHILALYLIETPFNAFANNADTDKEELPDQGLLCLWPYDIPDPTLADLTSSFFVLCTRTYESLLLLLFIVGGA